MKRRRKKRASFSIIECPSPYFAFLCYHVLKERRNDFFLRFFCSLCFFSLISSSSTLASPVRTESKRAAIARFYLLQIPASSQNCEKWSMSAIAILRQLSCEATS